MSGPPAEAPRARRSPPQRHLLLPALSWLIFFASNCAHDPASPSPAPPPNQALVLSCPAARNVDTTTAQQAVSYPAPTPDGGVAPVTSTCSPASNSSFPVGRTSVSCSASDATGRSAACSFDVTVTLVPLLKGTRFVAFGDSTTAGEVAASPASVLSIDPTHAYPELLRQLLAAPYRAQTIQVIAEGVSNEKAVDGTGRLAGVLSADQPDALLLLEGSVDLNVAGFRVIASAASALRTDIETAHANGVQTVFIATVPPQTQGPGAAAVPSLNQNIIAIAYEEGATLVDDYTAFIAGPPSLIGADGVHLTAAGQALLAQVFFDAIHSTYEQPPPVGAAARIRRR